jgi:hypothetical protein
MDFIKRLSRDIAKRQAKRGANFPTFRITDLQRKPERQQSQRSEMAQAAIRETAEKIAAQRADKGKNGKPSKK